MFDTWVNQEPQVWQLTLTYLFVELLGIASAIEAIYKTRTSQGAAAWAVALVMMPMLSVPLYWVFGRRKFHGYVKARRLGKRGVELHASKMMTHLEAYTVNEKPAVLEKIVQMPLTRGNRVDLLIDGEQTFAAILEAIRSARHYVLLEFYIVRDDELGKTLQQLLIEKVASGVEVYFLFDEIGSFQLGKAYLSALQRSGVKIHAFNSTKGWRNRFQLNFRNHRKIVVVDGQYGFIGGLNVGDEYMGRDPDYSPWRDTHAHIQGPSVICLQVVFMEDWHWATDSMLKLNWQPCLPEGSDQQVLLVATGPADILERCELLYLQLFNSAQQRLWIVSPYFVPDPATIYALQLAALRGVDVRIILPEKSDNLLVQLSSYSYLHEALQTGIRVYRYTRGFLHQKVMLVDDELASVGSANLDNRSFRLNFEANVLVKDQLFAGQVKSMLETDLSHCEEIKYNHVLIKPLWFRFMVRLARLMAPIQ